MLKERATFFARALLITELLVWAVAFEAARPLRDLMAPHVGGVGHLPDGVPHWMLLWVALGVWGIAWRPLGLDASRRLDSLVSDAIAVVRGGLVVLAALLATVFFAKLDTESRLFVALFAASGTAGIIGLRTGVRVVLRALRRRGWNTRAVAIVGDGPLADEIARAIAQHPAWGLQIVGRILPEGGAGAGRQSLGTLDEIAQILDEGIIDEVFFAAEDVRVDQLAAAMQACEEVGVSVRMALTFLPARRSRMTLADVSGLPVLGFQNSQEIMVVQAALKRAFDVTVSLLVLVLGAPLFAVIALAIKLDSKGPVLFRQERVGLNGRRFQMLKFRSMVVDAESLKDRLAPLNEADGPVFKLRDDPRVTRVGRWLRKTSLDELPQFWNVLKGEMSIVGPRPPLPSEVEKYERWQRRRLSVKPGITCIWQVSGRSDVDFQRWMQMDMKYIDNWSLWLDLKLFAMTIPAVLWGRGAR